jgi:hypothetical protein
VRGVAVRPGRPLTPRPTFHTLPDRVWHAACTTTGDNTTDPPMKHCTRCHTDKTLDGFYRHRGRADGLQPYCKECCKAATNERRAKIKAKLPKTDAEMDRLRNKNSLLSPADRRRLKDRLRKQRRRAADPEYYQEELRKNREWRRNKPPRNKPMRNPAEEYIFNEPDPDSRPIHQLDLP